MSTPTDFESIDSWLAGLTGLGLSPLLVAWVRALPIVIMVPAFGLPGMAMTFRSALAMVLAIAALPSLNAAVAEPNLLGLVVALLEGFIIAVPATVGIWIATMSGGLFDELGGPLERTSSSFVASEANRTGTLFGLIACIAFLAQGGPSRMALSLSAPEPITITSISGVVSQMVHGLELALMVSAPLVTAAMLIEWGALLVSRVTEGQAMRALVQPVQGLLRLVVLVLFLEWVLRAMVSRR